ncbi:putative glycosyl hydrolase [Actinoplanes missouriensis 431]|uniref:Exo-alpha-(1->6)-L-arabinopyranosidase n=1 Tax=Actinoplanes missouriensis (strain ATCC 14538 / DSM 43046 / CBS 188.64 / JCM 3121 / NBRC 102363 / NCIMB 12654 / NRRL B-3342 / UNCC 431) TaxID=512565 RepID=I0H580_ACTM4|nr:glycoside hydrolase family 3 C-terminal domain-containing protein [Actinoplanes missouriensis]BAL88167.1 putative glycosyl hydrolase [Actinoplanes missouriensis 431]
MIDVTALTLEQKASLLSGRDFWSTTPIEDAGIPGIVLTDGPHGVRRQAGAADHLGLHRAEPATCFPPAVAVGSSWDPGVAARVGQAIGREARALGVAVLLGPGVNIKRSPLCGRNFEYYSEDPYLSGVLGVAQVRAQQAEGVGASVKHFAANNQETDRMRVSADVDERTLREIYLPAFEKVVTEAQPATVMASYNKINGVYASQNRWLLTDLLRDEWRFTGAVVSDWGAVSDRVAALVAGLDLEMPGTDGGTDAQIVEAVRSGVLEEAVLDDAVRRILALIEQHPAAGAAFDPDAHHALARDLAAECAVLLRNENEVLPLDAAASVAVIGTFAAEPRYQGSGSSRITPTRVDTPLGAIAAVARTVRHVPGFAVEDAVAAAAATDVAVIFAGLPDSAESEGFDREHLELPAEQVDVIRAVAAAARRTVVVLANGGVVSLEGWHDQVDAVLEGFLLGQAGGGAIADLLYGAANPSGHLAETIPVRLQDTPAFHNFPGEQGHVRYGEGVMVGYRHHTTAQAPVRYPFGHGLSYTTFETRDLSVDVTGDDTATVSVTVANTGVRAGRHVVQVYVATGAGPVRRPVRELRAFTKIRLEPGEQRTVELALDRRSFAYWDIEYGRWVVAPGEYHVQVGENAASVVAEQSITLTGDVIVPDLSMDSTVKEWFEHPVAGPALLQGIAAGMTPGQQAQAEQQQDQLRMVESMPMRQFAGFLGGAMPQAALDQLIEATRAAR